MRPMSLASCFLCLAVSGCSGYPVTHDDVRHYTGLALCDSALVRDLTSEDERATFPGFSFHVSFALDPTCETSFRRQLTALPTSRCPTAANLSHGCYVEDAFPKAAKHTSIIVWEVGQRTYDMRFFQ